MGRHKQPPEEWTHGTIYTYGPRGCRCESCRAAASAKRAKYASKTTSLRSVVHKPVAWTATVTNPDPLASWRRVSIADQIKQRSRIDEAGCWRWTGRTKRGYGQFALKLALGERSKDLIAHRVSYEAFVGPIPPGLQIDHLRRVRDCVNPQHLEPVTASENQRRAFAARAS